MSTASRVTTSRRDLGRHPRFAKISPSVGQLDEDAAAQHMRDDPDDALALLVEMTGATDEALRELARRLAARVLVDVARAGIARRRGVGRLELQRASTTDGDVDVDASHEGIGAARAEQRRAGLDDLTVRSWRRPTTAVTLVVDRSGSMTGARLAAAAVAAATVVLRHPDDCSVITFSDDVVVLRSQDEIRSAEAVVGDLLRLRGHGTTDVALALRAARGQLDRTRAGRRVAVVLSDCRSTVGDDATDAAAALVAGAGVELAIVAPADDPSDAAALAGAVGCRFVGLAGPSNAPEAMAGALAID